MLEVYITLITTSHSSIGFRKLIPENINYKNLSTTGQNGHVWLWQIVIIGVALPSRNAHKSGVWVIVCMCVYICLCVLAFTYKRVDIC